MPSVEWNRQHWDRDYDWSRRGNEWSTTWGSVAMQWYGTILPRIHALRPGGTILEIGAGFGRWTEYLAPYAERLHVVDLSPKCLDACRERFRQLDHVSYHLTDGRSLAGIPDGAVDFVFSFDSLVHAEADVLEAYLTQLRHKLRPGARGFLHHSNIGAYEALYRLVKAMPRAIRARFGRDHGRAFSMTAERFRDQARRAGVRCVSQELVNWGTPQFELIDCFSVIVAGEPNGDCRVIRNPGFMDQVQKLARLVTVPVIGG